LKRLQGKESDEQGSIALPDMTPTSLLHLENPNLGSINTQPVELKSEIDVWLYDTWIECGCLGGSGFFRALKNTMGNLEAL
jgi:hypothetical protein